MLSYLFISAQCSAPSTARSVCVYCRYAPSSASGDLSWSMEAYRERLMKRKDASSGAQEEWDELEKSVVSHIADNVTVSIRGYDVELVILKRLG